jgi:hypothetical protein
MDSEWIVHDPYTGLSRAVNVECILRLVRNPIRASILDCSNQRFAGFSVLIRRLSLPRFKTTAHLSQMGRSQAGPTKLMTTLGSNSLHVRQHDRFTTCETERAIPALEPIYLWNCKSRTRICLFHACQPAFARLDIATAHPRHSRKADLRHGRNKQPTDRVGRRQRS